MVTVMGSKDRRSAILGGAAQAAELHKSLSLQNLLKDGSSPIDVFRVLMDQHIDFLFQPLDNLLGVFLKTPLKSGILVTTNRDLYVQRYTAAHELGHFLLDHRTSLDDERQIGFAPRGQLRGGLQEVEADAFASEFLMPRWLIAAQVSRQQWTLEALKTPKVVYQLSLRLGVSYQAMCWALAGHKVISRPEARLLAKIEPKQTKRETLRGPFLSHAWGNVWSLTNKDNGLTLLGTPDDVIQIELEERASAGLSWNIEAAIDQGFQVLNDEQRTSGGIGSFGVRFLAIKGSGQGELHMEESRHWDPASKPKTEFTIKYCLDGKETGFPRVCRRAQ